MTGALEGVYASNTSDSDNLTLQHDQIFANADAGVRLEVTNDMPHLFSNTLYGLPGGSFSDDQPYAISISAADAVVGALNAGNTVYDTSSTGIFITGGAIAYNTVHHTGTGIDSGGALIASNEVYASNTGVSAYGTAAITANRIHDNATGIFASGILVSANTVYLQGGTGIILSRGAEAANNVVYSNHDGILAGYEYYFGDYGLVTSNRVFNNTAVGIIAYRTSIVRNNRAYSNSVGISGGGPFFGSIANNVVYANSNQGILLQAAYPGSRAVNNTIYQQVGDALRVEGGSSGFLVANNIIGVEAGFDLFIANDSQTDFTSHNNLLQIGVDPNANTGFWAGPQKTLADWKAASTQDANSIASDPTFIDRDGPDNILGYSSTGTGFDGGQDDNFELIVGSPAINAGDPASAPPADLKGIGRIGLPDLGAFEFRGSSNDTTAPTITSTTPAAISTEGTIAFTDHIAVTYSEFMNDDAKAVANYELREDGADNTFGTADDVLYSVTPSSDVDVQLVTLHVDAGVLPAGRYRLTVFGQPSRAVHDLSGLPLDGDNNGTFGGNYIRTFNIFDPSIINGSAANDAWVVKLNAVSNDVEVYLNGSPSPVTTVSLSALNSMTFNGLGGDDSLTVNLATGNPIPSGGFSFDGGGQSSLLGDRLFVIGDDLADASYSPSAAVSGSGLVTIANRNISFANLEPVSITHVSTLTFTPAGGADALTLASTAGQTTITGTSNSIPFESLTFANVPTLILDTASDDNAGPADDSITIASSGLIATGLSLLKLKSGFGNDILTVNGGALTLDASFSVNLSLQLFNSAVVNLPISQHFNTVEIHNSARITLAPNGDHFIRANALTIDPAAKLDLTNNNLIVQAPAGSTVADKAALLASITQLIKNARAGGAWTGPGITSATAAADPLRITGLAIALNDAGNGAPVRAIFANHSVDANSILVKFTYNGDATLDGQLDADDYFEIDKGFATHLPGYAHGDIDHNNRIDADDYFLIDSAFYNQSGPPLAPSAAAIPSEPVASSAVEPAPQLQAPAIILQSSVRDEPQTPFLGTLRLIADDDAIAGLFDAIIAKNKLRDEPWA